MIFRLRPLRSHLWGPAPGPSCLPLYPQIQRRARHENRYIINACFNSERTALYSGRSVFMSAAYSVHASPRGRWFLAPFEDEQTGAQRGEGTCLRSQSREVAGLEHEPRSLRCQTSCSSTTVENSVPGNTFVGLFLISCEEAALNPCPAGPVAQRLLSSVSFKRLTIPHGSAVLEFRIRVSLSWP